MELHLKLSGKAEATEDAAEGLLWWGLVGSPSEQGKWSMSWSYMQTKIKLWTKHCTWWRACSASVQLAFIAVLHCKVNLQAGIEDIKLYEFWHW